MLVKEWQYHSGHTLRRQQHGAMTGGEEDIIGARMARGGNKGIVLAPNEQRRYAG